jgi:hypothetical protein
MSDGKIELPNETPPEGYVNMAFAVNLKGGKDHIQYVGPLKEEVVRKMLALLGAEIFPEDPELAQLR